MFRNERRPCSYFGHDQENRRQVPERFRRMHDHLRQHHRSQFLRHYRYFRYFRPVALVFNLLILYLLFSWVGFKGVGIFFAALIIIKEVLQFFFLLRLEKRIFKPMESLRQGLDEVAKGNYSVKVAYDKPNDLSFLIASFNEMTEKLSESEKMQAEYEENRKALIANISHDLKTPLTAIHGYIETLLEVPAASGEHRDKYLKIIYQNIIYVNRLIDDLVLFSKLDMQKLEFHYEEVSIRPFMNDLMEEYQFDCEEKNIGFHYRIELGEDVWLHVDGKRVHQAFRNIIGNAVQHGPETGLSIEVRLYRQGAFACIDIKDNGPGIPEDQLPFIFDRFYRIETERPKSSAGTGLGLAIARELLESQGGKLTVSSIINEGACFSIMLPILRDSGGGKPVKRILIIEDDPDIAELERDYLGLNGYKADIALDGLQGLKKAVSGMYDLIVVDLMLPHKDGYEIIKEVRKTQEIPMIVVSAKNEDIDKIRGLDFGADDYLTKPFSPAELTARIRAHIKRYERLKGHGTALAVIQHKGLEINTASHKTFVDGKEIQLTTKEYELLVFLASNPNIVFSKEHIFEALWGSEYCGDTATVAVHIQKIRKKVEKDPANPEYIETIWGSGYRFNPI